MTYGYGNLLVYQETGDMCEKTLHIGQSNIAIIILCSHGKVNLWGTKYLKKCHLYFVKNMQDKRQWWGVVMFLMYKKLYEKEVLIM